MTKGLARSMSRGLPMQQTVTRLRIPVVAKQFAVTDPGAALGWATFAAGGLPQGNIVVLGVMGYLKFSAISGGLATTFQPTVALGTAATADNVLAGAEVNLAPAATLSAAVANVTPVGRVASTAAESGLTLDNTDQTLNVNVNVTVPDAAISAAAVMQADGYIDVVMAVIGDD
jgi:hypothetical protein